MKNNYDLSDITLVILSRNRESELMQTLKYWENYNIKILVLHNSEESLPLSAIPNNTRYVVSRTPFGQRCKESINLMDSTYAILSSDDEIFLPSGLVELRDFLNSNPEYISAGGVTIGIGKYGGMQTASRCYRNMQNYNNDQKISEARLNYHFDDTSTWRSGAMYRLMRIETFRQMMDTFSMIANSSTPYIYEVSGELLITNAGPGRYFEVLYWIRNWVNDPVTHTSWDRKRYFSQWINETSNANEIEKWKSIMIAELGVTEKEFNGILEKVKTLRHISEMREWKNAKTKIAIPETTKMMFRRALMPSTLPPSSSIELEQLKQDQIAFESTEVTRALRTIYS